MKKNSKSPMKKEQKAKRVKAGCPVQREPKEVLAELVEKLQAAVRVGPEERRAWGQRAQSRVHQRYSWDAVTTAYERMFHGLSKP